MNFSDRCAVERSQSTKSEKGKSKRGEKKYKAHINGRKTERETIHQTIMYYKIQGQSQHLITYYIFKRSSAHFT